VTQLPEKKKVFLNEEKFLQQYNADDYVHPSVAADMVIFTVMDAPETNYRKLPEKQLCVLLIRRGMHPFLGQWALPGGFVRPNETVGNAARRELREETGLDNVYMEQLCTFSEPDRDPRTWVISCAHMALVNSANLQLAAGDDADRAAWFRCSSQLLSESRETHTMGCTITRRSLFHLSGENVQINCTLEHKISHTTHSVTDEYAIIENTGLAFDHARILALALERLRGKLEYTGIALHLMPARFTLTQLQQVYEVILGRSLLAAAFRRKIAPLVRGTDEYTSDAGHRPSQLFERNWDNIAELI